MIFGDCFYLNNTAREMKGFIVFLNNITLFILLRVDLPRNLPFFSGLFEVFENISPASLISEKAKSRFNNIVTLG